MESDARAPRPSKLKHPRFGGLKHLQRLLGLREDHNLLRDAVFISLDLEVSSDRQKLDLIDKPFVREVAFARLDTRDLLALSASSDLRSLITVQAFESRESLKSKKSHKAKQRDKLGRHCVFGPAQLITQGQIRPTIIRNLQISDNLDISQGGRLRNVVLVGHSIGEDLRILRYLDIDISSTAPIQSIINTHSISRFIFPPYHPNLPPNPGQRFSLAEVLAELGCRPPRLEFHNAGNDAVYSMYAMLLLAIHEGTSRMAECSMSELRNLEMIRFLVFKALEQGLCSSELAAQQADSRPEMMLGAGLRELASMAWSALTDASSRELSK